LKTKTPPGQKRQNRRANAKGTIRHEATTPRPSKRGTPRSVKNIHKKGGATRPKKTGRESSSKKKKRQEGPVNSKELIVPPRRKGKNTKGTRKEVKNQTSGVHRKLKQRKKEVGGRDRPDKGDARWGNV